MTHTQAITEETRRYINACHRTALLQHANNPGDARAARHLAHIHALTLGRLRGQTVAPWIHQHDLNPPTPVGGTR